MAASLPTYPAFDCRSEGRVFRWEKCISRLEQNLFIAYNINDYRRRKALTLKYAGDDLNDIVESLPRNQITPGGEKHFGKLRDALTNHFNFNVRCK